MYEAVKLTLFEEPINPNFFLLKAFVIVKSDLIGVGGFKIKIKRVASFPYSGISIFKYVLE